jgi:Plasmid replication region DNA-binding N-term
MSIDEVRAAVEAIKQEGERPTVRAVLARTGGSSRDVQKYLKLLYDPDAEALHQAIEAAVAPFRERVEALLSELEAREKPKIDALLAELEATEGPKIQALIDGVGRRDPRWAAPLPGIRDNPVPPRPQIGLDVIRSLAASFASRRDKLTAHRAAAWLSTPMNKLEARHIWEAIANEAPLTAVEAAAVSHMITGLSAGLVWRDREEARTADGVWQAHVLNAPFNPWVALPQDCSWERQRRQERNTIA